MSHFRVVMLVLAISVGLVGRSESASISLFMNGTYVDTGAEGANLQASLTSLGHTVSTFTGTTAADFTAAGAAGLIFFPEMENGDLFSALDAAAITALQSYVSAGGTILQANYFPGNSSLPNGLFGYSLAQVGNIGDTSLDAGAAAGTAFAGGPAVLPGSNAVEGVDLASLPAGALAFYHDGSNASVFGTTFGLGQYFYLGYDWFEGSVGEWDAVADLAITEGGTSTAPVPEPASLLLVASGLAYGVLRLRRNRQA